jgi:hypothetical protein
MAGSGHVCWAGSVPVKTNRQRSQRNDCPHSDDRSGEFETATLSSPAIRFHGWMVPGKP